MARGEGAKIVRQDKEFSDDEPAMRPYLFIRRSSTSSSKSPPQTSTLANENGAESSNEKDKT